MLLRYKVIDLSIIKNLTKKRIRLNMLIAIG